MKPGLIAVALLTQMIPVMAQQVPEPPKPEKPELMIGGQPPSRPMIQERCVDVEIGGSRSFGRLNQSLKRDVDKVNPGLNLPPIDARSADTRIGVVNLPGVQQQYGQNYGRSVVPFRLPPPVYGSPIGRR